VAAFISILVDIDAHAGAQAGRHRASSGLARIAQVFEEQFQQTPTLLRVDDKARWLRQSGALRGCRGAER
jgi:hypothetical protein